MSNPKLFPDYFTSKDPLVFHVEPIIYQDETLRISTLKGCHHISEVVPETTDENRLAPYEDNDAGMMACAEIDDSYDIVATKTGKFMTKFYVPSQLQSVIIGPRGQTIRRLEETTHTTITVPRINETGDVKIMGNSERSVASSRNQVEMLILRRRESLPITHFVSVHMTSHEIRQNFERFQESILQGPQYRGVEESLFQDPKKLHLTVAVLTLLDPKERIQANAMMVECCKGAIFENFCIDVMGVDILNDDPSAAHVLYGKVQFFNGKQRRQFEALCHKVNDALYRNGWIKRPHPQIKLHVTLMNSTFRSRNDDFERKSRESFDVSHILSKFKDYNFGKVVVDCLELSIRSTTAQNGYYQPEIMIDLTKPLDAKIM